MALSTKIIKKRISSVNSIHKITRAMEMVAASKMKKAVEAAVTTRSYAELALELLINISRERDIEHPLLEVRPLKKILVVIIGSNKGLCGGYNANINKAVAEFYRDRKNKCKMDFVAVGKKSEKIVQRLGGKLLASFVDFSDNPRLEEVGGLAELVEDEFKQAHYDKVSIFYTDFKSAISYKAEKRILLPVNPDAIKMMIQEIGEGHVKEEDIRLKNMSNYLFEPNSISVLNEVLPKLVKVQIYQSVLESNASEHSARMLAMKNASDSASEMIDDLRLNFNRLRQAAITQEIAEISSGALALNN